MQPLFDAQIEHLGPSDFLRVECVARRYDEMIPRIGLVVGLQLPASIKVLGLKSRLRCRDGIGAAAWRYRSSRRRQDDAGL